MGCKVARHTPAMCRRWAAGWFVVVTNTWLSCNTYAISNKPEEEVGAFPDQFTLALLVTAAVLAAIFCKLHFMAKSHSVPDTSIGPPPTSSSAQPINQTGFTQVGRRRQNEAGFVGRSTNDSVPVIETFSEHKPVAGRYPSALKQKYIGWAAPVDENSKQNRIARHKEPNPNGEAVSRQDDPMNTLPSVAEAIQQLPPHLKWLANPNNNNCNKNEDDDPNHRKQGNVIDEISRPHGQQSVGNEEALRPPMFGHKKDQVIRAAGWKGAGKRAAFLGAPLRSPSLGPSDVNVTAIIEEAKAVAEAALLEQQAKKEEEAQKSASAGLNNSRVPQTSYEIDYSEISVGQLIGEGAFGKVYIGNWRGTDVAVKILACDKLTNELSAEFRAEIGIMSSLRHPNIVLFLGACTKAPNYCLVTELVPRGSLWSIIHNPSMDLSFPLIIKMAADVARGMNYLHQCKPVILHRDLKSANLLVDESFNIKLSDFGLARVKAHTATMTGNCGTFQWMAPEVLASERYTEKADVFSFAIVCWEMVVRKLPYEGLNQIQSAMGVLNNGLRPSIPTSCPPAFAELIESCWNQIPEERPSFTTILQILKDMASN